MNFDPVEFGKQIGVLIKEATAPLIARIVELESRQLVKGDKGDKGDAGDNAVAPTVEEVAAAIVSKLDVKSILAADVTAAVAKHFELHPVKPGEPGKDAVAPTADEVAAALTGKIDAKSIIAADLPAAVSKYFEANPIPVPKNGDNGKDANPVDINAVIAGVVETIDAKALLLPEIAPAVAKHFELHPIPVPKNGDNGKDAEPIDIGEVAAEILESDAFKMMTGLQLSKAVDVHFQNHPVVHGKDAPAITDDQIAKHVADHLRANPPEPGKKGDDGIGMAGAMIDRDGQLIITTTKGEAVRLGEVVGKPGEPGTDGKDGLGFDDLDAAWDGERGLSIKFVKGSQVKEFNLHLPVMIHRGFYRDGMQAKNGDTVTHDGSLWYALRDTKARPCHENKEDWQLAARKGRDGDNAKPVKTVKDFASLKADPNG
jgi:hypothetical protein